MKRRLNLRFLIGLVTATVVLGGIVVFLHQSQARRNAAGLLQQADRAEEQGKLDKAEEFLSRYLSYRPEDFDALVRLALILDKAAGSDLASAQGVRALAVIEKALIAEPGRVDLRRRAAQRALELKAYPVARQHLEILEESKKDDGAVEQMLGQCAEADGDYAKAAGWYEKAIKHAPLQVESYAWLAGLLRRRLNNPKRADQLMDAQKVENGVIAATKGQSFAAYLARASYRHQFGLPGVEDDVERALELAPDNLDVLLAAVNLTRDVEEIDRAWFMLTQAVKRYPKDSRFYRMQATFLLRAGKPDLAVECLKKGVEAQPEDADLQWALAEMLVQTNQTSAAENLVAKLENVRFPGELLDYLRAQIMMSGNALGEAGRERWSKAASLLERAQPLLAARPDLAAYTKRGALLLAECYGQLGDLSRQQAAYSRALAIEPTDDSLSLRARLGLAHVLEALGKTDDALTEYRRLLPRDPSLRTAVARLLIGRNLSVQPVQRRWQEVEQLLAEADKAAPDSPEVGVLRAEVLAGQDPPQFDRARRLLEAARDQQPDRVERWLALITLAQREGKPQEVTALVDEAGRRLGDVVELRLARAEIAIRGDKASASEILNKLEQDLGKFTPADRRRLSLGLAQAHRQIGDPQGADRLLRRISTEQKDDLNSRLSLFDLALPAHDESVMNRLVGELKRIEGDEGVWWRYNKVRLLIDRVLMKKVDVGLALSEARSLLTEINARRPSWSPAVVAEAEINDLTNATDAAITSLLRAIELGENNPGIYRRAAQLLNRQQRYTEADQLMQRLLQSEQVNLADDLQLAAATALLAQDQDRALDLARRAAKASPGDWRSHLWLGKVLTELARRSESDGKRAEVDQRKAEAERSFRRAVELAGDSAEPWKSLVQFLASAQKKAEAEAAIQEAQSRIPADKSHLALAECYEEIGALDRAREQYEAALRTKPDDDDALKGIASLELRIGRPRAAEPYLNKILQSKTGPPESTSWARNILAIITATDRDPQRSRKALEILGVVKPDEPVESLRARATVLAMQPGRESRRQAIDVLEKIVAQNQATTPDLFNLAQLYELDGAWSKARERMRSVLIKEPKNTLYLSHFVRVLLRNHETSEAQIWLAKLEALEPLAPRTIELKARQLKAQGKDKEAITLLNTLVQDQPERMEPIARLIEELHLDSAAEAMYRRYVAASKQPTAVLALAAFLGRQGRTREALDLCEPAWKTCPPEVVANASVSVLQGMRDEPGSAEQVRRIESRLEAAVTKAPEKPELRVSLAVLRGLQGRHEEAVAIYRQILQKDAKNVPALNNLAWLLALKYGKGAEAELLIERVVGVTGPIPAVRDTRALISMSLGRSDRAIEDLVEATKQANSAISLFHLALAYQMSKDLAAATRTLQDAREQGFQPGSLDPLERPSYDKLIGDLAHK